MVSRGSILLVEDNRESLQYLERALAELEYRVTAAQDGVSALFCLANGCFDIILLDIMLPDMNGLEILDRVREDFSLIELPVIMLSAAAHSTDIVTALGRGANDYVTKPFDFSVIHSRIETQIALKRTEQALRLSEERYSLAAEATCDGLWDWKLEEDTIYVSDNWKTILGLPHDRLGMSLAEWAACVNPQDRDAFLAGMESLRRGDAERLELECRMRHSDGSFRWASLRAILVRGRKREPVRLTGAMRDITDSKFHHSLSKLPNAILMGERIEGVLERSKDGRGGGGSVLFIDLDGFRFLNQAYGPASGDKILLAVVDRLKALFDGQAILAHYGRDEFIVLIEGLSDPKRIARIADLALEAIQSPVAIPAPKAIDGRQAEVVPTACVGVVIVDPGYESASAIIQDAESAMNMAKRSGPNQFRFFRKEYSQLIKDRLDREKELRQALAHKQFVIHYQPQVRVRDGRLIGFEALIRRIAPSGEIEMPDRLIPFAEENGLIHKLGEWILKAVCAQIREWKKAGIHPPRVAVNLSPLQFRDEGLARSLTAIIDESGILPEDLELEITESKAMEDPVDTLRIMRKLKDIGISFSIDDFGTGYSSLSMLQRFPLSTLKIDKAFVKGIGEDLSAKSIIEAIISMARSLRFSTIAEGVETGEQLEFLKAAGCDSYQGYYESAAVSARDATAILRRANLSEA
jgi:diguanylate cyclase (GGDEF)-like protein/PAS domain S-box-containing protein